MRRMADEVRTFVSCLRTSPQFAEKFQEPRFQEPNKIQVRKNQTDKD